MQRTKHGRIHRRHLFALLAVTTANAVLPHIARATRASPIDIVRVGHRRGIKSLNEAARVARDGSQIWVDAGDYVGDVAVWPQSDLAIRAIGGSVRIVAAGKSAEEKAIFVTKGTNVVIEGIEFNGTRVPDRNGAGIRHEGGDLVIRNCRFIDNENGILGGLNRSAEIDIERSEFGHNGAGDGQSHNLYIGRVARLSVSGSYFHHGRVGHLLKSRAQHTDVRYNRLTDEKSGRASYELEFPNGGIAVVVGNIIEQGPLTENPKIISFGAEGLAWSTNELFIVNNTLVDDYPRGGKFLDVAAKPSRLVVYNNLLIGEHTSPLESDGSAELAGNVSASTANVIAPDRYDFRPRSRAYVAAKAAIPPANTGVDLRRTREYVHTRHMRAVSAMPVTVGAQQAP